MNCGDLSDKEGNIKTIDSEDKKVFIDKVKSLQKKMLEISLMQEQLKEKDVDHSAEENKY